jgi:hypothetical protein
VCVLLLAMFLSIPHNSKDLCSANLSRWSKVSLNAAVKACAGSRPGGLKDVSAVRSSGTCMHNGTSSCVSRFVKASTYQKILVSPMQNTTLQATSVRIAMCALQLQAYLAQALQSAVHIAGVAKVDQASRERCTCLSFLFILHVLFKQDLFQHCRQ